MPEDLAGKRVLVTGASQGIGAAVARGFGRCGARVAIHYRSGAGLAEQVAEAIRSDGGDAVVIGADLTVRESGCLVVQRAVERLGSLDVLVNNAGGPVRRGPLADIDGDLFDVVLALNARSVLESCKEAAHAMPAGGAIINTLSYVARTGSQGALLYAGAKAFLGNMTRSLAKDLAVRGIRVNAVSPGVIMTPFHQMQSSREWLDSVRTTIPLGRLGEPEECVGSYLFLASNAMSGYITGQTIEVNGGQTMP